MSRINSCLTELKEKGRKALIPYVTAGDPSPDYTASIMRGLVEGGADIIELGMPFSDPMADGPVIQLACERALEAGASVKSVLASVKEFRAENQTTPVVLMGYLNPIEFYGYENFAKDAKASGVDGVLLVDLTPEEATDVVEYFRSQEIDLIYLLSPTTTMARAKKICDLASGYVYYVSVKGVTGSATLDVNSVREHVEKLRGVTNLPIGVGFGIKDAETAAAVSQCSDGVIVGSVLVNTIAESKNEDKEYIAQALENVLTPMRNAMDRQA
ncbi:tryptophan synthase subunit alpha [Marinomonas mediterranea]|jgi:tryptophan synthase, alpha chain (EC 4.2.1.20)|uniref:Tryptophan synthase alpha chain n=1 Tax=Marinomonas mediterranea (strain ATCC 700492 / JCM 21426 / NBRC 103028 / MMB-1) TaxID=717774 RepID=F2K3Y0_MARM1|nr:tryptophan synthase subunit alpha [Marinomonas mediterranea]ADZ91322.1 Tryptophan synthase alpha chain [Marinomonas mediterranea MMB-1]WCN09293.1 tryptophan synthase subunit alpha [Marinomonas mediterranea]WCN13375.1 tryptophan synthase subunit alpha [Marinomonas mediterranea]WCN17443.1 tryptophan synthase subunit alpha [Marinomonas mediterranea MMB-1]